MNKVKLTNICHKVSQKTGLTFNTVMVYYFLEHILNRLSNSTYREHFIFKGGFLLSNAVGVTERTTVDIDILLQNMGLTEAQIIDIFTDILSSNVDDIHCEIHEISSIKEQDEYGGFRVSVLCQLENIRQIVPLDIATGDIITPGPINYQYSSIFSDKTVMIRAYPVETMIAEKLQTVFSRGFLNSRSKDYYDLHTLYNLVKENINMETVRDACTKTFLHRETNLDFGEIKKLLISLKQDEIFIKRWSTYSKKNTFVKGEPFEIIIQSIISLVEILNNCVVSGK